MTDDARGTVTVISLADARVTSTIEVGAGAHHLSFDPIRPLAWVALGESARTIVILSTANQAHPRVIGQVRSGLSRARRVFQPQGNEVWITSATGPDVAVFNASDQRLTVPRAGRPRPATRCVRRPLRVCGQRLQRRDREGRRRDRASARRARSPYGSFELDAGQGYVVASSLLRGTLAIYNPQLNLLRVVHLAPATREVAISTA